MRQVRPHMRRTSTSAWRSAVCSDAQSPAKKPPTKAGLGLQGRLSPGQPVEGSGAAGGIQSIVDSNYRPADMSAGQHRLHRPASIGGPRRGEPQWMPADEGRSNARPATHHRQKLFD
jgi:hypothetical protein